MLYEAESLSYPIMRDTGYEFAQAMHFHCACVLTECGTIPAACYQMFVYPFFSFAFLFQRNVFVSVPIQSEVADGRTFLVAKMIN